MVVTVIVGILASMAAPRLSQATERALTARAVGDIRSLAAELMEYGLERGGFPTSLAAINRDGLLDPWGNPYQYTAILLEPGSSGGGGGVGGLRKDRFLVPINSDFDLYSMGPDGESTAPLNAKTSQDDVIRASDGSFVGLARDF